MMYRFIVLKSDLGSYWTLYGDDIEAIQEAQDRMENEQGFEYVTFWDVGDDDATFDKILATARDRYAGQELQLFV